MYRARIFTASAQVARGVRYNSTAAKASAAASGVVSKASGMYISPRFLRTPLAPVYFLELNMTRLVKVQILKPNSKLALEGIY